MEDYGARRNDSGTVPGALQGTDSEAASKAGWERSAMEKLMQSLVDEKRRARRWGIFFKLIGLAVIAAFLFVLHGRIGLGTTELGDGKHTALVELNGVIDSTGDASADNVTSSLQAAFKDDKTVGVVLRINSPGGSPVQAGMIYDEIKRLRAKYPDIPIYAVVEEVCASGGYYVAAATDRIYVDKASLIGSIGVLMDGFGFVAAMDKLGVERRLLTAGRNKGFLDMFSPLTDEQKQFAQTMLTEIHQQFIDVVRKGRGSRLKETPETFSGLIWTGARGVEMGLADAFGTLDSVARDVIKAEDVVDYSTKENIAERLAKRIGASAGQAAARTLRTAVDTVRIR